MAATTLKRFIRLAAVIVALGSVGAARAQFSSGSTGADGALNIPAGNGDPQTIDFDPAALNIDVDGDGVYNFTTINIPQNITLRIRATEVGWVALNWLATGNVMIDGILDISGNNGHPAEIAVHLPSVPGPGGFPGGTGGVTSLSLPCRPGFGPGAYQYGCSSAGTNVGNNFLFPLSGGSGGGGDNGNPGPGGGAGGGAILIASDTAITVNGSILATGGDAGLTITPPALGNGGAGAGGSIRLVSPTLGGAGTLNVQGGRCCSNQIYGGEGRVRFESNLDDFSGTILCTRTRRVTLVPSATYLVPSAQSRASIRVATVNGIAVPARPNGTFALPDVTFSSAAPVTFAVEASGIPLGTTATIFLWNETEYLLNVVTTPLAGTVGASTATASITIPNGLTAGYIYASWTP